MGTYIEVCDVGQPCISTRWVGTEKVFVWHDDKDVIDIMVIHVNDFIYGGSDAFHKKVIGKFREIFEVGSEESCSMKYIGVLINQSTECIHLSTNTYYEDLPEIDATNIGSDRTRALFPEEITRLK